MAMSSVVQDLRSFVYEALPARVIFGSGTLSQLGDELERAGISRPLFLSTSNQRDFTTAVLGQLHPKASRFAPALFAGAVMHTPTVVTERALVVAREHRADGIVAIGGGSTIGLGKAIALRTDLPQLVVPTTYAGSEMTPILGETANGVKTTQRNPRILPEIVIYDVDLTMTLPVGLSAASGLNAIAHAVEALYARDRNPIISLVAEEAVRALARALPLIAESSLNRDARAEALYGAWLCGTCLGAVGMALHHKLCHALAGKFDLPHAQTHAVLLPHALAYNASAAPDAALAVARALGASDPARALYDLAGRLGVPQSLSAIGMPVGAVDAATDEALRAPYWNPRSMERPAIRNLIAHALEGLAPPAPSPGQLAYSEVAGAP